MTPSVRRDNQRIERAADMIRWHRGEDGTKAVITYAIGHSGDGFYVHNDEYPDEGADFLGRDPGLVAVARAIVEAEVAR